MGVIAAISVETGIPPTSLLDCPPELFNAIINYMKQRATKLNERK